jgi:hypothetical protein
MRAVSDQKGGSALITAAMIVAATIADKGRDTVPIYSEPKASASEPQAARPRSLTSPRAPPR